MFYIIIISFLIICFIIFLSTKFGKAKIGEKYNFLNTKFKSSVIVPGTTKVTIFNTITKKSPLTISFPEQCSSHATTYGFTVPDKNKVSLALSGGGSRAFTAAIGYFRALTRLGLHDKAQYTSSVSGGSWFYGLYSYCEPNTSYKNIDLLGVSCGLVKNPKNNNFIDPSSITMDILSNTNTHDSFFGKRMINDTLISNMFDALKSSNISVDDAWTFTIGKIVLEYYGLNMNIPVSLSSKHANTLATNNISQSSLQLSTKWPFWLCNTALIFDYIEQYPYSMVTLNPLYSGIPHQLTLNNNTIGGIVYDNALFGNIAPPANLPLLNSYGNCTNSYVEYSAGQKIRTLKDMIGTSSTFYASILYNTSNISPTLGLFLPKSSINLIPRFNIWGNRLPVGTTKDSQCDLSITKINCVAPNGYDANSCLFNTNGCYSISSPQCDKNEDCKYKTDILTAKIGCYSNNINKSSMYCKNSKNIFNPTACECDKNNRTPYIENTKNILNLQTARLGDGGFIDNIGVIPLVARGVKSIIGFANNSATSVEQHNDLTQCLSDTAVLFGFSGDNSCQQKLLGINTAQVFNKEDYPSFAKQFETTFNEGGPCYARAYLDVLPNAVNGVAGGYKVDLLIILLQPAKNFVNSLPLQLQFSISNMLGDLYHFPNYATAFQNPTIGPISLTLKQINLITTYTEWSLYQEPLCSIIKQMFA